MPFDISALNGPHVTHSQQYLLERVRKGTVYFWRCGDPTKQALARAMLADLVFYLAAAGYKRCLYPGGLPDELTELQGFCLVCPVPNDSWDAASCPSWKVL